MAPAPYHWTLLPTLSLTRFVPEKAELTSLGAMQMDVGMFGSCQEFCSNNEWEFQVCVWTNSKQTFCTTSLGANFKHAHCPSKDQCSGLHGNDDFSHSGQYFVTGVHRGSHWWWSLVARIAVHVKVLVIELVIALGICVSAANLYTPDQMSRLYITYVVTSTYHCSICGHSRQVTVVCDHSRQVTVVCGHFRQVTVANVVTLDRPL